MKCIPKIRDGLSVADARQMLERCNRVNPQIIEEHYRNTGKERIQSELSVIVDIPNNYGMMSLPDVFCPEKWCGRCGGLMINAVAQDLAGSFCCVFGKHAQCPAPALPGLNVYQQTVKETS